MYCTRQTHFVDRKYFTVRPGRY